jgi:hypothetical protein
MEAHPGFKQRIGKKTYTIKYMYHEKPDALDRIKELRKSREYSEVILYPRIINGELYGDHPWCILFRGKYK